MRIGDMTERDMWNLMLDYYPNFYCPYDEEGGDDEDGTNEGMDDDEGVG